MLVVESKLYPKKVTHLKPYRLRSEKIFTQFITFSTLRNEEFTFNCANSEDIKDVVQFFLDGLKKRSKYVVATEKYKPQGRD